MNLKLTVALLLIMTSCCGCFTRWVMSESEVKNHYASKSVKPTFFTIKNDSVELFCATDYTKLTRMILTGVEGFVQLVAESKMSI